MDKVLPSQITNMRPVAVSESRAELMVGDRAPRLRTGEWIQGEPVAAFDSNHIYVVELWATWCGPCVQSIPHVNQVWQRFKDKGVIVVGQDVSDSDDAVAPFVEKMGDSMTYRVALDDKSQYPGGWMAEHWWKRKTNICGIPMAFIINRDGFIAWIGHPMGLKDKVLAEIVSGDYDMALASVEYRKELQIDRKFQELQKKLKLAIENRKWPAAEFAMDRIDNLLPKFKKSFTVQRLKILLGKKEFDDAYQFAETFGKTSPDDHVRQNSLAWTIVTAGTVNDRCIGLAESMAERAVQLTKEQNAEDLDTLARVQFTLGRKQQAVATQEKAVNIASSSQEKARFESRLASYRAGELPNTQ